MTEIKKTSVQAKDPVRIIAEAELVSKVRNLRQVLRQIDESGVSVAIVEDYELDTGNHIRTQRFTNVGE